MRISNGIAGGLVVPCPAVTLHAAFVFYFHVYLHFGIFCAEIEFGCNISYRIAGALLVLFASVALHDVLVPCVIERLQTAWNRFQDHDVLGQSP